MTNPENALGLSSEDIIRFNSFSRPDESDVYILSEPLRNAIRVALMLQQPLLITGEPGTGKTSLAYKVAAELNRISNGSYRSKPFFFSTKSGSTANDLFYTYDAISHFFDANIARNIAEHAVVRLDKDGSGRPQEKNNRQAEDYISLQAFGKAIIASHPEEFRKTVKARNAVDLDESAEEQRTNANAFNSVVLIDEIDKATRDFPNDILSEIERYSFRIREADFAEYSRREGSHIFLIMTSNSEKALPEPFLRRCVFFHIEFPDAAQLKNILDAHAKNFSAIPDEKLVNWAIQKFEEIRNLCKEKKPATAELISWVRALTESRFDPAVPDSSKLLNSLPTLVKHREDLQRVKNMNWSAS